jgi:hypothetical protein
LNAGSADTKTTSTPLHPLAKKKGVAPNAAATFENRQTPKNGSSTTSWNGKTPTNAGKE